MNKARLGLLADATFQRMPVVAVIQLRITVVTHMYSFAGRFYGSAGEDGDLG